MSLPRRMLAALLAACALALGWLYLSQEAMIFPAPRGLTAPDLSPIGYQAVTVTVNDGTRLAAYLHPPEPDEPSVIVFHGNGELAWFQQDKARALARAGFGVLLAEYRGYGASTGAPSQDGLFADALASYDFLRAQTDGPIAAYGFSLGTGVAVHLAAERQVSALVLEAPFDSLQAVIQRRFPYLPVALMLRHPFRSDQRIGQVSAPILMMHGTDDQVIPMTHGRALADLAPPGTRFEGIQEAGHNDLQSHGSTLQALAFLSETHD